jgi:hypothetical protein
MEKKKSQNHIQQNWNGSRGSDHAIGLLDVVAVSQDKILCSVENHEESLRVASVLVGIRVGRMLRTET